jgi:hypothetical protein
MNQNKNKSSINKNLKPIKEKSFNLNQKDYSSMLSRLVNQYNTNQCIKIIVNIQLIREKQKKIDSLIQNIQEKESFIMASSNAAIENMKRRKRKEEDINKRYEKFYKEYMEVENF